jgi:sigma-B regulation protein RsbU (phosphoserine phosphatase)
VQGQEGLEMSARSDLVDKLTTLNRIAETLNQAVDVRGVLDETLADLVHVMGLESGWIFLKDPEARDRWWGNGYVLGAHHNLPPALALDNGSAWARGCTCQRLCSEQCLTQAHNVVECSRLADIPGDRRGLAVHASTPLRAGDHSLGILNVAAPEWASFSPESLSILTNVGSQMGVALERARLYDLLKERRHHEQAALLELSQQLLARRSLDDLIDYVVDQVRTMLLADACALLLPTDDPDLLAFRAAVGWRSDPVADRRHVPAHNGTGPGLAMRQRRILLAEDLLEDDPAPWLPEWVREEGFRGHALVPLVTEGRSVGALVVNTRQPRRLDEEEARLARLMANQAALAIEKARLHEEEVKVLNLEKELAVGREIQLSLLPKSAPEMPGWEWASFYNAAREVGGDFYDFFRLPGEPRRLGMVIADVAGKGVPAALFMARTSTMIRAAALEGASPSAALTRANDLILKDRRSELFLTAFYAALDPASGRLEYAAAGHNRPLWLRTGAGQLRELAGRGIVLGVLDTIELEDRAIDVAPGDYLVFYTDGVTEAMDKDHRQFGEERLQRIVRATAGASAQQMLEAVVDSVQDFTGNSPQSDDVTLFVVRRVGSDT